MAAEDWFASPGRGVSEIYKNSAVTIFVDADEYYADLRAEVEYRKFKTLRQRVSRLVCSTLAFSKKVDNRVGAIRYFICHYNLTRTALLG